MTPASSQQPAIPQDIKLAKLKAMGFDNTSHEQVRRLIMAISGPEGTAKSHFVFTAPPPIFLFDVDTGTEGVVEKFQMSGKDIYIYRIRVPKGKDQKYYKELWGEVDERMEAVLDYNEGTLAMDTASENFELARLAHFGKLTQVMPHHYTEVNAEWREFAKKGYDSRMNMIMVNKVKPRYVDNVRTREVDIAGFGETPYLVQVSLMTFKEMAEDGLHFGYIINKCRRKPSLTGQTYKTVLPIRDSGSEQLQVDPILNFNFLLDLVHGPVKA